MGKLAFFQRLSDELILEILRSFYPSESYMPAKDQISFLLTNKRHALLGSKILNEVIFGKAFINYMSDFEKIKKYISAYQTGEDLPPHLCYRSDGKKLRVSAEFKCHKYFFDIVWSLFNNAFK